MTTLVGEGEIDGLLLGLALVDVAPALGSSIHHTQ
jgi:hypothetical protein